MTPEQRKQLRHDIGDAWIEIQDKYKPDFEPHDLLPEMVAAFMGIAWFVSEKHLNMDAEEFIDACTAAVLAENNAAK